MRWLSVAEFYANLRGVASKLLQLKGQQVTFSRETSSGFNAATGVNTTSTSTFQSYGAAFDYNSREIDGTIIQIGDIRFLMEGTTEPKNGDTVTIDSEVYRVMSVKPLSPAGTPVVYEAQLRK